MTASTRERRLLDSLLLFADTLVSDYDVFELLQELVDSCCDILGVDAAGVLLADLGGELELVASTSEASRLVEVMQVDAKAGPCFDSYTTGEAVSVPDVAASPERWSRFRESAMENGFAAVFAVPLRLRDDVIGTLNLLRQAPGDMDGDDLRAGRALADMATIGVLHERTVREQEVVRLQLQHALDSRVIIEQAKGVVAARSGTSIDRAFDVIRGHARSTRTPIAQVAHDLVDRRLELPS